MKFIRQLLHGHMQKMQGTPGGADPLVRGDDLRQCYDEYARAVAHANDMLQKHGPASPAFAVADIAGMRLFHKVKAAQGLKNSRRKPG